MGFNVTSYGRRTVRRTSTEGLGGSTTVITDALGPPNNFTATDDPTVDDDEELYEVGSRWINTTTDEEFVATDVTDGAAVWVSTTDAGVDASTLAIPFIIDGGGATITTGVKGFVPVPFACTIIRVQLLADQSGSIVVDIWKDTYANYPPTDADSITASAVPTISAAVKAEDSTLTGWTTAIAAGDILGFNVDSVTTCQRVTLSLTVVRL